MLNYIRANNIGLPLLKVDTGSFKPSADTIRSSGPLWKDREIPVGKRIMIDNKEYIEIE